MNQQLTLNILSDSPARFENFFWQGNEILYDTLISCLDFSAERIFYLWGETGSGKSHLLQACCHYLSIKGFPCAYLPLRDLASMGPEILDNLENLSLIAIDDLDAIEKTAWEEALFHCYNKVLAQEKTRLIMTASCPLSLLKIQLPDLQSRLSASMVFHIAFLDESACLALLQERAQERGLLLPEEVAQFLIKRFPRNPGKLIEIFEKLDKAALKEQHRLTVPFVKKTLNLYTGSS